jgi:hypothetical protein
MYTNDELASALIKEVTTNTSALKGLVKAYKAILQFKSYSTNTDNILKEEYTKVDFKPRYEYAYISIDFDLIVTTSNNCIPGMC